MMIGGANFVAGTAEIIMEFMLDVGSDFLFIATCPCHKDGSGRSFSALNSLWVVVGHFGRKPCCVTDSINVIIQPGNRGYTHCRAVSVAVVCLAVRIAKPLAEHTAIADVWVHSSELAHTVSEGS